MDLRGADLRLKDLSGANLAQVDLTEADFRGTHLEKANLSASIFNDANFTTASMHGASLHGASLRYAYLQNADLQNAILQYADLTGAILTGTNLTSASLWEAILTRADLNDAILSGAQLAGTNFTDADLARTDFTCASMRGAVFNLNDLSQVKGLRTVQHSAPSIVDFDTLYRSRGKIPESFLRGCGVPDSLIEYLPSLIGAMEPIQFYSCFISYSTKDEEFAKHLHSRMRDNNLRVWFANEDLKGGYKLHEQIDEAIRVYDKFIIVLSPESLRSKWVMNEVRRTRKAELASNQRKFFPIGLLPYKELEGWECIDPETGTDLAAEIREYFVPDFRGWKNHDSFEKAFVQLLEGLKAVDAPPAPRAAPKISEPNPNESKQRRLKILEEQQARMGTLTPPYVTMEIEDLRKELGGVDVG